MIDAFDWVIRAYGREMACYDSGGAAMALPLAEAEWQYTAGALGSYRTDRFLCLAQTSLPLDGMGDGGWVTWNGEKYEVMTVRPVLVAGQATHLWMALRPAEEQA